MTVPIACDGSPKRLFEQSIPTAVGSATRSSIATDPAALR